MNREVSRMAALVEDLLTLTRLESPGAGGHPEAVDLDALVAETVDEQSVRSPDQQVSVEAAERGSAVVMGDRDQLRSVVLNLAGNALKYAQGGTHLWRTAVDGEHVTLSLTDSGRAIPAEVRARMFDRFYRGPEEAQRAPGSGLGLAIVRSIVEAHDGDVAVTSGPAGNTFTVRLPRAARATPSG
jgi:signal transduction histidine kinase